MQIENSKMQGIGIASMGLHLPPLAIHVRDLAKLRNVDPDKYTVGLDCQEMALCPKNYNAVNLGVIAAQRALKRWNGEPKNIGLVAVGTESALDMSRPLSAWIAEELGLKGAIRSYEVKHACYGGTLALRQAIEWKASSAKKNQAALVIATDIALYAPGDPGEPTQGAAAVAMIIDQPLIAQVETHSYPWSEPAFDFWRPVGNPYPSVNGKFSLACYSRALQECFRALINEREPEAFLETFHAHCFHVPFPKMVKKAFTSLCELFHWNAEKINSFIERKIEPTLNWNRLCGNAYTASLWLSVANTLNKMELGQRITAFSYGSGFGSELLTLIAGAEAKQGAWQEDMEEDERLRKNDQ
jgi:hydroxymethylglutaryl-CoA synthase